MGRKDPHHTTGNFEHEIDATGLFCPEPLLLLNEKISVIERGERVKIVLDDPTGEEDIKRWAGRTGNRIVFFEKDRNEMVFIIEKT